MHELLAPLVLILHRDAKTATEVLSLPTEDAYLLQQQGEDVSSPDFIKRAKLKEFSKQHLAVLLDRNFLEHDAYILFKKLMEQMKPYFEVVQAPANTSRKQYFEKIKEEKAVEEKKKKFSDDPDEIFKQKHHKKKKDEMLSEDESVVVCFFFLIFFFCFLIQKISQHKKKQ